MEGFERLLEAELAGLGLCVCVCGGGRCRSGGGRWH